MGAQGAGPVAGCGARTCQMSCRCRWGRLSILPPLGCLLRAWQDFLLHDEIIRGPDLGSMMPADLTRRTPFIIITNHVKVASLKMFAWPLFVFFLD